MPTKSSAIWLNAWATDKSVIGKSFVKNPDLYEQTLTRLETEINQTSPDRQIEIMKRLNYQSTIMRERAHEEFAFLKKGSEKSEIEQLISLSTSPAYRDADRAIHLVGDGFGGSDPAELLAYMIDKSKHKDLIDKRPSMDIALLTQGILQEKIGRSDKKAEWINLDKQTAMESLAGRGYSENDVRPALFNAYSTLMADTRSASDSFTEMKSAVQTLTNDDPYNSHKNAGAPLDPKKEDAEFSQFYRDKSVQSIVTKAASEKGLTTIRAAAGDKTGKILNQSLSKLRTKAVQAQKPKQETVQKKAQKNL